MAASGTHLYHYFTCQPVCGPARSCLQTGQYATQTGCWRNGIALDEDAQTLAKSFGAADYQTGYIGKWHLGNPNSEGAVAAAQRGGYDYWLAANALEMTSDAYDTRLYNSHGEEVKLPGYRVHAPNKNVSCESGSSHYVEQFLYDLRTDPWELNNLAGLESHRAVADLMKQRLITRMVEAGEAAPIIENAPPLASGQRRVSSAEMLE